jgi:hypothetical protein
MSPFGTSRKSGTPSRMSAIGGDRTTSARSELYRFCRVGPGSLTPSPSQIPDVNLSIHPARVTARRLPPSADALGSSRYDRLAQVNGDGLPPSLHEHCTRFIATARQSAPLRRIGTFGLAVGAACAFSLSIAGQVLTFRTRAWLSFAPPTCRMPLGPSQDTPQADPGGRVTPRF